MLAPRATRRTAHDTRRSEDDAKNQVSKRYRNLDDDNMAGCGAAAGGVRVQAGTHNRGSRPSVQHRADRSRLGDMGRCRLSPKSGKRPLRPVPGKPVWARRESCMDRGMAAGGRSRCCSPIAPSGKGHAAHRARVDCAARCRRPSVPGIVTRLRVREKLPAELPWKNKVESRDSEMNGGRCVYVFVFVFLCSCLYLCVILVCG